jgi:hypothetical protein
VFWTGGRFVLEGHADQVYDWTAFRSFQLRYGEPDGDWPVPYPPMVLPVLAAVALLPYVPAYLAWMAATSGLACVAIHEKDRGPLRAIALLVAPATLVTAVAGQTGLLSAGLAVGGLRLLPSHPVWGGAVLGLLAYKPQLFVLIPVALLAAREGRALLSVVGAAFAAVLLSVALYGLGPWASWLDFLPEFSRRVDADVSALGPMMISVSAALRGLGASRGVTFVIQGAVALVALVAVWRAFRAGPSANATATFLTAAFLVTPYAYVYDLPLLAAAVILTVDGGRAARATLPEIGVLLLAWSLPVIAVAAGNLDIPLAPLVLLAALWTLRDGDRPE